MALPPRHGNPFRDRDREMTRYSCPAITYTQTTHDPASPATGGERPHTDPAGRTRASRPHDGTISRGQLLAAGVGGVLATVLPAKLALAAPAQVLGGVSDAVTRTPAQAMLQGYPMLHQQHVLSCEAAVASMATRGRITEQQILDRMPYNVDPWLGFRGSINGGQSLTNDLANYGIYAPPLAQELRDFGYVVNLLLGATAPAQLRYSIGVLGRPVAVWVIHYLKYWGAVTVKVGGNSLTLYNGEHARLAIGYDSYGIHTLDPIEGPQYDAWATLTASWALFNYMGISVGGPK